MSFAGYFLASFVLSTFSLLFFLRSCSRFGLIWFGSVHLVTTAGFVADHNNKQLTTAGPPNLPLSQHCLPTPTTVKKEINGPIYREIWRNSKVYEFGNVMQANTFELVRSVVHVGIRC